MPHRSYASTANYRFGFNGKENDNEPKGLGNQLDFGMRIYDPRVGRFFSTDPLQFKYANESPYAFVGNSPLLFVDPDGRNKIVIHYLVDSKTGKVTATAIVTEYGVLKSQEVRVQNIVDKHDTHTEYEWYDVQQVVYDYFDENGKKIKSDVGEETLIGPSKTTTWYNWEWLAKAKVAEKTNSWGGIEFYSKDGLTGQGQESKIASGPIEREEIDLLLGVMSMTKSFKPNSFKSGQLIQDILSQKESAKRAEKITDLIKFMLTLRKASKEAWIVPGKKDLPSEPPPTPQNDFLFRLEPGKKKVVRIGVDSIKGKFLWPGAEWRHSNTDPKKNDTIFYINENKK